MKNRKMLMTLLLALLLIFPLGTVALADPVGSYAPDGTGEVFIHGDVPAETDALDSMTPALHGVLLAVLNHGADRFSALDETLAWESLYNMVSLYGQMDSRSQYEGDALLLPSETIYDYAASFTAPLYGEAPEALSDRMTYDAESDCWLVVCGADGLSELQLNSTAEQDGVLYVSGELIYLVDGTSLAEFEAVLIPQDNMFGYMLATLELV